MTTRREFLAESAQLAFGLGALNTALGQFAIANKNEDMQIGRASVAADNVALGNDSITAVWSIADGVFRPVRLTDGINRSPLPFSAQGFTLTLANRTTIAASEMRITSPPRIATLTANPRASRKAEQLAGRRVSLTLQDRDGRIEAIWRGILRDGSHYILQELTSARSPLKFRCAKSRCWISMRRWQSSQAPFAARRSSSGMRSSRSSIHSLITRSTALVCAVA